MVKNKRESHSSNENDESPPTKQDRKKRKEGGEIAASPHGQDHQQQQQQQINIHTSGGRSVTTEAEGIHTQASMTNIDIGADLDTIVKSVKSIHDKVASLENKYGLLDININGEGGVCDKIVGAEYQLGENVSDIATLQESLKESLSLTCKLTAIVIKQDQKLTSVTEQLDDIRPRMMRDNVLIHNIQECDDSVIRTEVFTALSKGGYDMTDIQFDRIHRVGEVRKDGKPRVISAKPTSYQHGERLISKYIPYGQKQKQAWVSPQYTERVRETRRQLGEIATARKAKQPGAKIKMRFTSLTINGQKIKPNITTPSLLDILTVDHDEKEELERLRFTSSEHVTESRSTFVAWGISVKNIQDVRKAYKGILLDPDNLAATHNIAAYILPNGEDGYCDDGDYGMGRAVLSAMKDANTKGYAIFLTREYGGIKLGFKRFNIVRNLAAKVMSSNNSSSSSSNAATSAKPTLDSGAPMETTPFQSPQQQHLQEQTMKRLDSDRQNGAFEPSLSKYSRIGALSKTLMGTMGSTGSLNSDVDGAEVKDRYQ